MKLRDLDVSTFKKTEFFIFLQLLYLLYGIQESDASILKFNINNNSDEIIIKNVTNMKLQYYPKFWTGFKFKNENGNDKQKLETAMKLFLSFPVSPGTVPPSTEPHNPFEN